MLPSLSCFVVCIILLTVSICLQIAGITSDSWLVIDKKTPSETYNFGLYYVSYCRDDDKCDTYYITDLPKNNPLGIGNDVLDKIFTVYRVGTALAAALTFLAVIFFCGFAVTNCKARQSCISHDSRWKYLHGFTLAGGLLAITEAAHYGTEISARSAHDDTFAVPYSIILTGVGGAVALVVYVLFMIMSCRGDPNSDDVACDTKDGVPETEFVPPKAYFENAPQSVKIDGAPAHSSGRTYADFLAEKPMRKV